MEKRFTSCDMLTHDVWNELKPLLIENGLKILKAEEAKCVYVEFDVNQQEYERINHLIDLVERKLNIK